MLKESFSGDQGVQTDVLEAVSSDPQSEPGVHLTHILDHLDGMTATYTRASLLHLYEDIGKLEDNAQRRLLELRQHISN